MKTARLSDHIRSLRQVRVVLYLGLFLLAALPGITAGQTGPAAIGQWGPLQTLSTVPVHISVLPDGRLLYWGRDKNPADQWDIGGSSMTYTWDPATGATLTIPNTTTNLFCSGHSFLPDGRLLVSGGHARYEPAPDIEGIGEDDVNIFDYRTNSWLRLPTRLPKGRWYPSNVTLGTGETVFVSGYNWDGSTYQTLPDGRVVPQLDLTRVPDMLTLSGYIRPFTASSSIQVYPYLHLNPSGKVFVAGPGPLPAGQSLFFDPLANGGVFSNGASIFSDHFNGTAVTFDGAAGKVLMAGGRQYASGSILNSAEIITPSGTSSTWQATSSLIIKRKYHNSTVLPDGKVLVTGGTQCAGTNQIDCPDGPAWQPELWNPQTGSWTLMAASPARPGYPSGIPRVYHSVGLLLPDARVLVGGGGLPAAGGEVANGETCIDGTAASTSLNCRTFGHKDFEIFSPPYLFNADGSPATQPVIASAPTSVSYGQTFSIGVANPGSITKVSLVRLPSVTHGLNQDQRINFMVPTVSGSSSVNVTAPALANTCPPGYYMLFVLNSNGVPSKAKIVKVLQDDGYLDGVDCNQIWGWAWDRNNPNTPVNVDIYDGPTLIATVAANLFRQDLANAGKGNGFHSFNFPVPASMRDGKAHQISVNFAGSSNNLGSSPRSRICDVSLFPPPLGTVTTVSAGGSTWEQATRFTSYVTGNITHIRYYKVSGETGSHVGRIWNDTGTQLAQAPFLNETASGWQEAALSTPLQIAAGSTYRVSYNVNLFGAKIVSGLSAPAANWPLTALSGVYSTPSGTFPNTGSVSNFLADFRFTVP